MDFHLLSLLQIEAKSLQNYWRLNKKNSAVTMFSPIYGVYGSQRLQLSLDFSL